MQFLVLGNEQDEHAAHIFTQLRTRGHRCEFLDSEKFPESIQIWFNPATDQGSIDLATGSAIGFDEIDGIYWRRFAQPAPPRLPDPEQNYIAANDARGLFDSLLKQLPTNWVNGWQGYQLHQTKPYALSLVAAQGVPVPATLLGNDPQQVEQFVAEHRHVIFKPVQGGAHTQTLTSASLTPEVLARLQIAPVTFQQRILGTDIRAFVAGERVVACAIKTEAVDFRDDPYPEFEQIELPENVRQYCLRAAQVLHLKWTGIDFRRTDDGRYFFLEANPSPMFLGFEEYAGLPLTDMLLDLLEQGRGSCR